MQQQEAGLPGDPLRTSPVSSEEEARARGEVEKEMHIRQATDMIGQLAKKLPTEASEEHRMIFARERREAEDGLMKLGIHHGVFASLILSYNIAGSGSIRAFMENHFSEWDGEEVQLQS